MERWHVFFGEELSDAQVLKLMEIGFLLVHIPIAHSWANTREYLFCPKHWYSACKQEMYHWTAEGIYLKARTKEAFNWALSQHFVPGVKP